MVVVARVSVSLNELMFNHINGDNGDSALILFLLLHKIIYYQVQESQIIHIILNV